jgi:hypothetical protein
MTWSVHQHWDPLKVCVVGRSYPPEFYSWITVPHVRSLFEKIAIETEEDFQNLIKKLKEFDVEVLRPNLPRTNFSNNKYLLPPMTPRDFMIMIGDTFYENYSYGFDLARSYLNIRDPSWPKCNNLEEFFLLPKHIQEECVNIHGFNLVRADQCSLYNDIYARVRAQDNTIKSYAYDPKLLCGAQISRIGKDLYFGTNSYDQDVTDYKKFINEEFANTRNHIVNTGGHSDATYCPICPGLIISLYDIPTYADTFPGWEVIYLPNQSWAMINDFLKLKEKNKGRWWIPGFEHDQDVINTVEQWLGHWTGYVEETVFDVNMLIVDPKNVMVFNYNKQVFDALDRFGITAHIIPFRHRWFWDGGIHCVTADLHRTGKQEDFFPERS